MTYVETDVFEQSACHRCEPCIRMRLMEMGFIQGQKIKVEDKKYGLYVVHLLSDNGQINQTIGLRQDEIDRLCLE